MNGDLVFIVAGTRRRLHVGYVAGKGVATLEQCNLDQARKTDGQVPRAEGMKILRDHPGRACRHCLVSEVVASLFPDGGWTDAPTQEG
jgi:hypothetical protein